MYQPFPEPQPAVPANPEAEQAVLGAILIDPDAVVEVAELLTADDFYQEKNGWIYQAILDLNARNTKADFLTVTDELDRRTGGMWPSDVIVLAAPPGGGKTALALGIAHQAAKTGAKGAVFSLEMQDTQVGERILAPESGYTAIQIRLGDIRDWGVLDAARARASTDQLLVDDSASLTVADLAVRVKRLHLRHGIQFVVIDYVQLLSAGQRTENRTQELSLISRRLKALAKELGIAVIVVAQLNREFDKRADKRPRMSDLEGSSQWEKDASVIVFIHRESQFVPEADVNAATLILAKARNGQIGEFPVGWNPRYSQFTPEPLVFGEADRRAHRLELLRQCEALPYTWADWQLHPLGLEEVLRLGRAQIRHLAAAEKSLIGKLGKAMAYGHGLDEAIVRELAERAKASNGTTPAIVNDFLVVGMRAVVLQRAR